MELSAQDICELVKTAAERMIFVDLPSSKTGSKSAQIKKTGHRAKFKERAGAAV